MHNRVQLVGRLGEDPQHTVTGNGTEIVEFSFATSEKYRDKEDVEWHRIKMFGPLAQLMKREGFKGQMLFLEGKVHYSSWIDEFQQKKYATEIICNTVKILEWKNEEPKV